MTDQQLYGLSGQLNKLGQLLRTGLETLINRHSYRYKTFVDTSPRGFECRYAKLTREYLITEDDLQTTRKLLVMLRDELTKQINELDNVNH